MPDVDLIKAALAKGGEVAMSVFGKAFRQWNKGDGSLVTEVDLAVNEAMAAILRPATPDHGWLSEEGPEDPVRHTRQRCWILDPIDGTRSFAMGRQEWCIGLALTEGGLPIASGVLQPVTHRLFLARHGKGATLNGASISVADGPSLQGARIAANATVMAALASTGATQLKDRHTPSITRLAEVASGAVDAMVALGPKHDWDLAPGALLVAEAGGRITDLAGRDMHFNRPTPRQNGLVAAGKSRHGALLRAMEAP